MSPMRRLAEFVIDRAAKVIKTLNKLKRTNKINKNYENMTLLAGGRVRALNSKWTKRDYSWARRRLRYLVHDRPDKFTQKYKLLPMFGDPAAALGGGAVKIAEGDIEKPFMRTSEHTGEHKFFDPNQIFLSPSIRYCELPQYAREVSWQSSDSSRWNAQIAFQMRFRPGTYHIG